MVPASMPKLQFSRLGADGSSEELMSKTNPEVRDLLLYDAGNHVETGVEVRGIARAGRYHHSIRLKLLDLFNRRAKRNDSHSTSPLDERSNDVSFHTTIEYHDVRPRPIDSFRHWCRDLANDVVLARERRISRASDQVF